MVSASGDWDWVRLRELLPQHLLEQIAVEVLPHYEASPDIPSWRSGHGSSQFFAGYCGRTDAVALWGRSVCIVRSCWEVGLDCWRNAHARFMVARLV
ncbi:hypothetical protein V6N13_033400 [Hibiscus sabdariffa]